jgi:hypothetical protein
MQEIILPVSQFVPAPLEAKSSTKDTRSLVALSIWTPWHKSLITAAVNAEHQLVLAGIHKPELRYSGGKVCGG